MPNSKESKKEGTHPLPAVDLPEQSSSRTGNDHDLSKRKKPWTAYEKAALVAAVRRYVGIKGKQLWVCIARELGRSMRSVQSKLSRMMESTVPEHNDEPWTVQEDGRLLKAVAEAIRMGSRDRWRCVAKRLGRSVQSVVNRFRRIIGTTLRPTFRSRIPVSHGHRKIWSVDEDCSLISAIIEHRHEHGRDDFKALSQQFGRSPAALRRRWRRLREGGAVPHVPFSLPSWTEQEDDLIREHGMKGRTERTKVHWDSLGGRLGRDVMAIRRRWVQIRRQMQDGGELVSPRADLWTEPENALLLKIAMEQKGREGRMDWKPIADQLGRSPTAAYHQWLKLSDDKARRRTWKPEEDQLLQALVAEFQTERRFSMWETVARVLGCSAKSAEMRYWLLKKKRKNPSSSAKANASQSVASVGPREILADANNTRKCSTPRHPDNDPIARQHITTHHLSDDRKTEEPVVVGDAKTSKGQKKGTWKEGCDGNGGKGIDVTGQELESQPKINTPFICSRTNRRFTAEEDNCLMKLVTGKLGWIRIGRVMKRPKSSVRMRWNFLVRSSPAVAALLENSSSFVTECDVKRYTPEEDALIIARRNADTGRRWTQIGKELGRTPASVRQRANYIQMRTAIRGWSEAEVRLLCLLVETARELGRELVVSAIARKIGRASSDVETKIAALTLDVPRQPSASDLT
ncbi:hypothetical protein HDV00_012413 [Rhizophlyctis rosea]|nr:hypothetical protein HDV00_012413 [Rhizophlyctis rosea]